MSSTIEELARRRAAARDGGGENRVDAQHAKGKLTARERLDILLDEESFEELDMFVENVNGGRISGQRGGVKAGHC